MTMTIDAAKAVASNDQLGLVERLRQRTLPKHGGREADSWAHHWNLTPGDSELHAEAVAVLMQARAALQKTMAAWGGTCAWHADVKAAIAAIDGQKA